MLSLLLHDIYAHEADESGFSGAVADRYKLSLRELDAVLSAVADAWRDPPLLATGPNTCRRKGVALTVDDGGVSYGTILADRLESRGWRAHCFVCTGMIDRPGFLTRQQLRDLDRRGHVIGSHSATHPTRFSACTWARMVDEWRRSRSALEDLLGHEVRTASLPGGYFARRVALAAREAGLEVLFTSEPWNRPREIGGCTAVGRLTIRPGLRGRSLSALASGSLGAYSREWMTWNAKKLIKPVLGAAYPRLGEWIARLQPQGGDR